MADIPPRNFRELFADLTDPYAHDIGGLVGAYAVGAATPAQCYDMMDVPGYPAFFLGADSSNHNPIIVGAAFLTDMPGHPHNVNAKWVFMGDLSPSGVLCNVTCINNDNFHLIQNVWVPDNANLGATWAAVPPGTTHLPAQDGEPNAVEIRTRRLFPVPHPYVAPIQERYCTGLLDWPWVIQNVALPIIGDANQAVPYAPFVDFVKASSTMRPPANPGDPARRPETELPYVPSGPHPMCTLDVRRRKASNYLPGLLEPTGVHAQIAANTAQVTQLTHTLARGQNKPPKTIETENPVLFDTLLRLAEVATLPELRSQWVQEYGTFPKGGHHGAFDTMVRRYSRTHGWVCPLLDPSFTTDLLASRILSNQAEDLSTGLTLGRFNTELSAPATVATRHNQTRAFGILTMFGGNVQGEAMNLALTSRATDLPALVKDDMRPYRRNWRMSAKGGGGRSGMACPGRGVGAFNL